MSALTKPEIEQFLNNYRSAWKTLDPQRLLALWDQSEASPVYIAEEVDSILIGWEAIQGYWSRNASLVRRIELRTSGAKTGVIAAPSFPGQQAGAAGDISWLTFQLQWSAHLRPDQEAGRPAIGGRLRVFAVLRRRADRQWKLLHYAESPLGALPFLRSVYEAAAVLPSE